jgi:hypothetical protein
MASVDHPAFWLVHSSGVGPALALRAGERPRGCGSLWERYNPGRHAVREAEVRGSYLGRWRNGSKRPVLKHGPRSLTSMRVFGCQARPRNESECRREPLEGAPPTGPGVYRRI